MFVFIGDDMLITRGDTGTFDVIMEEKVDGEFIERPLQDGHLVKFLVKTSKKDKDSDALISKTVSTFQDGKAKVKILPTDTENMEVGSVLYYAVKIILSPQDVFTISQGSFIL